MNDWLRDLEEPKPKEVKIIRPRIDAPRVMGENIMYDIATKRLEPTLDIDFDRIANLSSFQRFIIEVMKQQFPTAFKKVNPRADKKVMAKEFNKRKQYMKDCMAEFKEVLKKRKELVE